MSHITERLRLKLIDERTHWQTYDDALCETGARRCADTDAEVERLAAEIDRLTRERDELKEDELALMDTITKLRAQVAKYVPFEEVI